ncbi:peptide antibiotic resistance protein [Rhizobium herbae]|uniref:Peptide antibiotic resistance protein n=1 Tax=Rhizobium herbae TaxID=508661 RepID=A0ABS7HC81_9HYPH|nr:peptide antibiotic resistance protein [Rhizobium herbae]MBW9064728.1 peptide antibiotic resistance protein [Rhizobium herbae]
MFLQTFGRLRLLDAAGDEAKYPRKGLLLIAYLATSASAEISREEAAEFLWGNDHRAVAFTNLRKLISRLRPHGSLLTFSPTHISLDRKQLVCDADAFDATHPAETPLSSLVDLINRTFLADTNEADGLSGRWLKEQRQRQLELMRARLLEMSANTATSVEVAARRQAAFYILERFPDDQLVRSTLSIGSKMGASPRVVEGKSQSAGAIAVVGTERPFQSPKQPRVALLPPIGVYASQLDLPTASALIDDVAIGLCALRGLSIVAPYTAERIRASDDKLLLLERYDVSYVVDTKLTGEGLVVQIIFVPSDNVIYADRFEIARGLLSSHRKALAEIVADRILAELKRNESALSDYEYHPDAYQRYLFGVQQMSRLTLPSVRGARKTFREALQQNANFSHAYSGLAKTYSLEWVLTARGDPELLRKAEESARFAIERNPEIAYGFKELGVAKLYLGELDESLDALSRAEELSPHYADAIYSFADSLIHASRPKDGLEKIDKAIALNPLGPDEYFWCAAGASYFVGAFDKAISRIQSMSNQPSAYRLLAASCAMLGDTKRAHHYRRKDKEANPQFDLQKWLAVLPIREPWQKEMYREGLVKAGY